MNNLKFDSLKKYLTLILGTPYYANHRGIVFCGDSTNLYTTANKTFVDLIITSPPYNIGKEYENIVPIEEYVSWSESWIGRAVSLLNSTGSMLLNLGYIKHNNYGRIPISYLLWDKIPLYLNQEIVWNYSAGVACKNYLSPRNEKLLWYVKNKTSYTFNLDEIRDKNVKYPNSKKNGRLRTNTLGKNPSDVWEIAKVTTGAGRASKERTPHPCQFPMDLLERAVLGFSNPNDIIYDPFMGSGSVFEAAFRWNRYCIGIEINESYCKIIKDRIDALTSKRTLFSYVS